MENGEDSPRQTMKQLRESFEETKKKIGAVDEKLYKTRMEAYMYYRPALGLELAENIEVLERTLRNGVHNYDEIRRGLLIPNMQVYFDAYNQRKEEIWHFSSEQSIEDELTKAKADYDDLISRKEEYVREHGRTAFAASKSRLHFLVLKTDVDNQLANKEFEAGVYEQKEERLKNCYTEFKKLLWDICVSKLNHTFKNAKNANISAADLKEWQSAMRLFVFKNSKNQEKKEWAQRVNVDVELPEDEEAADEEDGAEEILSRQRAQNRAEMQARLLENSESENGNGEEQQLANMVAAENPE